MRARIRTSPVLCAFPALGTVVQIRGFGDPSGALLDRLIELTEHYESLWSIFRDDSLISRINALAGSGRWVTIDPATEELLNQAMCWERRTGGAVTPLIGPLSRLWNVKAWLAELAAGQAPSLPGEDEVRAARELCVPEQIELGEGVARLGAGARLDLGGIAKGYIADALRKTAIDQGLTSVLVSVGTSSLSAAGGPWRAGIRSLERADEIAGVIELTDEAMATSGDYLQRLPSLIRGRIVHHTIDPRTGYPSTGPRQVSVRCANAVAAEVAATCLMVTGGLPEGLCADYVVMDDAGMRCSEGLGDIGGSAGGGLQAVNDAGARGTAGASGA